LPRPTQLYSEKVILYIKESWLDELNAATRVPVVDFYKLENYIGHPDQNAFQNWLCERLKKRPNPEMGLANYITFTPMIAREIAVAHFPESMVDEAVEF